MHPQQLAPQAPPARAARLQAGGAGDGCRQRVGDLQQRVQVQARERRGARQARPGARRQAARLVPAERQRGQRRRRRRGRPQPAPRACDQGRGSAHRRLLETAWQHADRSAPLRLATWDTWQAD
jgi:hypothetical protein